MNKHKSIIKRGSTWFLRGVLVVMGLIVLALCIFFAPTIPQGIEAEFPFMVGMGYPMMIGLYITAIIFFIALYQTFKILSYIDKDKAFSELSVMCLKKIKYCGIGISVIYLIGLWPMFQIAQWDDAPGLIPIWFTISMAPLAISVFSAVLQRLLQNAIDIKSENELTV